MNENVLIESEPIGFLQHLETDPRYLYTPAKAFNLLKTLKEGRFKLAKTNHSQDESKATPFQPRLIRLRDVPLYLGMDRNLFNKEVRPGLTEIPIGVQGIAFDRFDLDAWVEEHKSCNGRLGLEFGGKICQKESQVFNTTVETSGQLINDSKESEEFSNALKQTQEKKRK